MRANAVTDSRGQRFMFENIELWTKPVKLGERRADPWAKKMGHYSWGKLQDYLTKENGKYNLLANYLLNDLKLPPDTRVGAGYAWTIREICVGKKHYRSDGYNIYRSRSRAYIGEAEE